MAAFTAKDPADRAAFDAHWRKILADERIVLKTILYGEEVAGYIMVHPWFGEPEMSYWLGKAHWGQGIATAALSAFLEIVTTRPLHARVAQDNLASRRVLEKCEFTITGEDKGFANARGEEVDEWILILDR
jgi:RimJ/RimL family protein N-acetyltransferase